LDNPPVAERFGYTLIDAALSLRNLPERGRFVPEFSDQKTREIIEGCYRIIYRINEENKIVDVSRFWDGARLLTLSEQNG